MKLVSSIPNGEAWRAYSQRAAAYAAQLREMGLPHEHPERVRARAAILRGIEHARKEKRKCAAARRLIAVLTAQKKALAAA